MCMLAPMTSRAALAPMTNRPALAPMTTVTTLLTLLTLALGCSSSAPSAPSNGTGGGEPEGLPTPASFLAPSAYDCSATGPFLPPPRPHALDCFADAACTSPLVAAHRMATPFAPENSLSALRAAILLGVDIVETDVRLTKDGEVVLLHDAEVDRTLDGSGKVENFTLAELGAMTMKSAEKPGDFSCDRLPTLHQAMLLAEGAVVVELEVKNTAAGVLAAEYLRAHNAYDRAFLLCDPAECEAVRAAVPDAPIMTRPQTASEVAGALAYEPAPILVHIDAYDSFLTSEVLAAIAAAGAKPYASSFLNADIEALGSGKLDGYLELYDRGLSVVQTELPHVLLLALGRLP
ncbi:MAG: glycerophosphodiester phosphodiesterase family protein [Myxococcales bacterium]|nr:glycerophosphodiester phosphodiesterase family protein [Myxococcales bacterium]